MKACRRTEHPVLSIKRECFRRKVPEVKLNLFSEFLYFFVKYTSVCQVSKK